MSPAGSPASSSPRAHQPRLLRWVFRAPTRLYAHGLGGLLGNYERAHPLLRPVVRRTLSALVGWTYDGSDHARSRLVRERPLVGFRPA